MSQYENVLVEQNDLLRGQVTRLATTLDSVTARFVAALNHLRQFDPAYVATALGETDQPSTVPPGTFVPADGPAQEPPHNIIPPGTHPPEGDTPTE